MASVRDTRKLGSILTAAPQARVCVQLCSLVLQQLRRAVWSSVTRIWCL